MNRATTELGWLAIELAVWAPKDALSAVKSLIITSPDIIESDKQRMLGRIAMYECDFDREEAARADNDGQLDR